MSAFIQNYAPLRFPEVSEWKTFSSDVVSVACEKIGQKVSFFELLDFLAAKRGEYAKSHAQDSGNCFGRKRVAGNYGQGAHLTVITGLNSPYDAYNAKCIENIYSATSHFKRNLHEFVTHSDKKQERVNQIESSYNVEVYDYERLKKELPLSPQELYKKYEALDSFLPFRLENLSLTEDVKSSLKHFLEDKERVIALKKEHPDLYATTKLFQLFGSIYSEFPSPKEVTLDSGRKVAVGNTDTLKNGYIVITKRTEINKKLYAISQLITWIYFNYQEDPLARMKRCSYAMIAHQDVQLIDATLQEVSAIFQKVVSFDSQKNSQNDLIETMAHFRYLFAHAMPFERGSAAIGEWLEQAIYRFHGYKVVYNDKKMADLEAMTALLYSEFLHHYPETFKLQKV